MGSLFSLWLTRQAPLTHCLTSGPFMSAQEQTLPLHEQLTHVIDRRWLLALYAVIPLSLLLVISDAWLFDGHVIYQHIPTQPEDWPFWTVIFGLPHIIASLITMADREYLT